MLGPQFIILYNRYVRFHLCHFVLYDANVCVCIIWRLRKDLARVMKSDQQQQEQKKNPSASLAYAHKYTRKILYI